MNFKDKLAQFLHTVNLPAVGLGAYVIKCLIIGVSIPDALIVAFLGSVYCFKKFLDIRKQPPVNQMIIKEIENLKGAINTIKLSKGIKTPLSNDEKERRYW